MCKPLVAERFAQVRRNLLQPSHSNRIARYQSAVHPALRVQPKQLIALIEQLCSRGVAVNSRFPLSLKIGERKFTTKNRGR
ncbi:hypothetical protein CLOSTMETH_03436 [[Clostridium] methylpentosum DSM 5476]|uniref:Uncharacterized protein n=1 Tax=[Clostridium] methylpentosum DSM 5476 TaxID=537013 RepID=C0EHU1_9FIRM|nr:hypothetical protein CLOSTMETH_03436 [[Clostridium] methylpentosum DSM 5476]